MLAMRLVTRQAADPFVNAGTGAVVSGTRLKPGERCVALIAERLPNVGIDADPSFAVLHLRHGQAANIGVHPPPAIVKRQCRTMIFVLLFLRRIRLDKSIPFIDAKPATAMRINRSRPALSVAVAANVPASSSCAS